jgi:hypothetical protein
MHPIAKIARIAGAVYLSTLRLAIYFWSYLPGKLIVRGNATASPENILGHETLFRFSILGDLFTHVILLCLAFLLYRLLFLWILPWDSWLRNTRASAEWDKQALRSGKSSLRSGGTVTVSGTRTRSTAINNSQRLCSTSASR